MQICSLTVSAMNISNNISHEEFDVEPCFVLQSRLVNCVWDVTSVLCCVLSDYGSNFDSTGEAAHP